MASGQETPKLWQAVFGALRRHLAPHWGAATMLTAALLASSFAQLAGPQLLKQFIDAFGPGGSTSGARVLSVVAALVGVSLVGQGLQLASAYLGAQIGWSATNAIRDDLTGRVLNARLSYHLQHGPGELLERIEGDAAALATLFADFLPRLLTSVLVLVGIVGVLLAQDVRLGCAVGGFALLALTILRSSRRLGSALSEKELEANVARSGFIEERLEALDDIRAYGAGPRVSADLRKLNDAVVKAGSRAYRAIMLFAVFISNGLFVLGMLCSLALVIWMYKSGQATIGSIYLVIQYSAMLRAPIENMSAQGGEIREALACLKRVEEMRCIPSQDHGDKPYRNVGNKMLELKDVCFSYDRKAPILSDASFTLMRGESLGILGPTGSGKSTIIRLIANLYEPTSGKILLGGQPINKISKNEIRRILGVATQDVEIINGTVRDNLTLFEHGISDAQIMSVIDEMNLGVWLNSRDRGLDSLINGAELSDGQAQLLALARVIIRDPEIFILDEPSSKLDRQTEQAISAVFRRIIGERQRNGRAVVLVSHRSEAILRMDRVVQLSEGKIKEVHRNSIAATQP